MHFGHLDYCLLLLQGIEFPCLVIVLVILVLQCNFFRTRSLSPTVGILFIISVNCVCLLITASIIRFKLARILITQQYGIMARKIELAVRNGEIILIN